MILKIIAGTLCLLSTFSCVSIGSIKGDKKIITKVIPIKPFSELELGGNIEKQDIPFIQKAHSGFNYTQSQEAPSLQISIDENLFDLLAIEQKGEKLIIRTINDQTRIRPTQLIINGKSANLNKVNISGCLNFNAESAVKLEQLAVSVSGVGDVIFSDLSCDQLQCQVSGVGKIHLIGQGKEGDFSVSGVGNIHAFDCPIEKLDCSVSGVGGIEVNALHSINASASGVGNITYKGNPEEVKKSASGVGKIKKVD